MAKQYGNFTDFISVARASSGTCLRKVKFGPNLVANGDFRQSVDGWTISGATTSVSSAGVELTTTSTAQGGIYQAVNLEFGKVYRLSMDCAPGTSNGIVQLGNAGFAGNTYQNTTVDGSLSLTFTPDYATTFISIRVTDANSGETCVFDNISIQECQLDHKDGELILFNHPENVARVEYDEYGRVIGTLIEEARTNSITYSEDQSNAAWTKTTAGGATVSVIPSSYQTPDGGYNGYQISNLDTSGDRLDFFSPTAAVSGASWTYSAWFRGSGLVRITVNTSTGVGGGAEVNVVLTDEWVRHTTTVTFSSPTGNVRAHGAITRVTGAAPEVHIYGAQLEQGSFATSYIPTSGSTATRSADIDSIDVSQFGYNQKAGTVLVEFNVANWANETSTNYSGIWDFYGNIGSNADGVFRGVTTGAVRYRFNEDDSTTAALGAAELDIPSDTGFDKVAVGLKSGSNYIIMNGGTSATGTGTAATNLYSTLQIGQRASGGNYINGHIKSIKYYPRRLTNTQLQEQTA